MEIKTIEKKEYIELLDNMEIPIWCDIEAIDVYQEKEIIKVLKGDSPVAVFLIPLVENGVRRRFRFFPYLEPILLSNNNNSQKKKIYQIIFNYIFKKYDYTFIPLSPNFNVISSISSQGGFVEMRHTHIYDRFIPLDQLPSKIKNHIKNAMRNVDIVVDEISSNYDFKEAIKGSLKEQSERSKLAKKIVKDSKGFYVKAVYGGRVIAGLTIIYDNNWACLLHSYQKEKVRGTVSYMIFKAMDVSFNQKKIRYFDFEGSVIDEIDDFFSNFNGTIITYPYIIYSKDKAKMNELINRSINIEGRIKVLNEDN